MAFDIAKQYEPIWKFRPTDDAPNSSVHYHFGTNHDGYAIGLTSVELELDGRATHSAFYGYIGLGAPAPPGYISIQGRMGGKHPYGAKDTLLKKPQAIRLIFGAGWNSYELLPLGLVTAGYSINNESRYLPVVGAGGQENCINYLTIGNDLTTFANSHNMPVFGMEQSGQGFVFTGPDKDIGSGGSSGFTSSETIFTPEDHPSRWLMNLAPRYAIAGQNSNIQSLHGLSFSKGKQLTRYIPIDDIVGGEVLNIVFVSDGYCAYHGVSSNTFVETGALFPDKSNKGNRSCFEDDLQRVIKASKKFKKWGLIIVNSCKNPVFFPLWYRGTLPNNPTNDTRAYAQYDAQIHFREVESRLRSAGVKCKLLMREVSLTTPISTHLWEKKSLEFAGPQIPIETIMASVNEFWSSGTL